VATPEAAWAKKNRLDSFMFAGLPKLFDRSFFIGYFLPAFLLLGGLVTNLYAFKYIDEKVAEEIAKKDTLGAVIFIFAVWLLSILLMTFSGPIIRLLEGYGDTNPFRVFYSQQREQFRIKAQPHLTKVDNVLDARRRGIPETDQFEKLDVWRAANDFPERLDLVLPTRLGNIMRAYERYSDVVYGIEAIAVWPRLSMIIPKEAQESLRETEALFDFSINMLLIGIITIATSCIMMIDTIYAKGITNTAGTVNWRVFMIVVMASVFFILFSWSRLPDAARERGDQVKSIFDLYRKPLAEALGFELPATEAEERKMWQLVSRRMLLRVSDDRLPGYNKTLDDFRKRNDDDSENDGETDATNGKPREEPGEENKLD
jgi:hypothetical protein